MSTTNPRVQVTLDAELADALANVPRERASKSRLIRDLALRGARAEREDRERAERAIEYLVGVANGDVDYDFEALREVHAERERSA